MMRGLFFKNTQNLLHNQKVENNVYYVQAPPLALTYDVQKTLRKLHACMSVYD